MVLECYRRIAALRCELPQLTDPAFGSVSCSVEDRVFTMRRGEVLVVVNFGDSEALLPAEHSEVRFVTPAGATLEHGVLTLPAHAGALLA